MVYPVECYILTREECAFSCSWVECCLDFRQVCLAFGVVQIFFLAGLLSRCTIHYQKQGIEVGSSSQVYGFPVVMYACESWTVKKAECRRIQTVKNLSAIQENLVGSLGQEDPLEKGMATHSSILACRIPWTEESGRLQSMG